jgi:hypothetical protein
MASTTGLRTFPLRTHRDLRLRYGYGPGFLTQENLSRSKAKFRGSLKVREVPEAPRVSNFRDGREKIYLAS